jgi:cephalosporin hydroxylase
VPCRFGHNGPQDGLNAFLKKNTDFAADRTRELLFTDHPSGYLKRERVSGPRSLVA